MAEIISIDEPAEEFDKRLFKLATRLLSVIDTLEVFLNHSTDQKVLNSLTQGLFKEEFENLYKVDVAEVESGLINSKKKILQKSKSILERAEQLYIHTTQRFPRAEELRLVGSIVALFREFINQSETETNGPEFAELAERLLRTLEKIDWRDGNLVDL